MSSRLSRRAAIVNDTELQIGDGGVQRKAEEQELQGRRHDQRDGQTAIAADLVELFDDRARAAGRKKFC